MFRHRNAILRGTFRRTRYKCRLVGMTKIVGFKRHKFKNKKVDFLIEKMQEWNLGGYNLIWQIWCVWSGDTEM